MRATSSESRPESLGRGDFVRVAYRLGRAGATGVLTVHVPRGRAEVLVLRRGQLLTSEADALGRVAAARLAKIAATADAADAAAPPGWVTRGDAADAAAPPGWVTRGGAADAAAPPGWVTRGGAADAAPPGWVTRGGAAWSFDGGTAAYPPGAHGRVLSLVSWVRQHVEAQLDATRADRLVHELAGVRLALRPDHVPDGALCDDTDRRILAAMSQPRRLDQIWPLARTPRFRLLAFIHFLRAVGALTMVGVAASAERGGSGPHVAPHLPDDDRAAALRLLGVAGDADREACKRAYRRMARALHPDLNQDLSDSRRRELEAKLAVVTAAYQQLV